MEKMKNIEVFELLSSLKEIENLKGGAKVE